MAVYRRQDAIFVTSERDAALLAGVQEVPKFVIPNGVDLDYFRPALGRVRPHSLVFTGSMNYYPNADGAVYFLQEIFPRIVREVRDATITIVGNSPPKNLLKFRAPNVEVTGFVPDVRPFIDRSAVYVVPLRMGGGTRLKVMEAMAMKKPVVTTSIGCEGIRVRHGESVTIADEPDRFAGQVVELLRDPQRASRLSEAGHETVRAFYGWDSIGKILEKTYECLIRPVPVSAPDVVKATGSY
jgi:glycosyltransferase involved in cell wall biosynthesis